MLITGAAGEIGQALIKHLSETGATILLTLDLQQLSEDMNGRSTHIIGDILDQKLFARLVTEYEFDSIFHLAALLSTRSEFSPELAHQVNVNGTLNLMRLAADQSQQRGKAVRFMFPSSIAAYGLPNLETKQRDFYVREWDWNYPTTMYGCNKLYCEQLGNYYSQHYQQLAEATPTMLDFRSVRFPGLISAYTVPSGGTSDYGPEMLHAAAKGVPYRCFVREDSTIPFMAMPDAIRSLLHLWQSPRHSLSRLVYNVTSFSLSAEEFKAQVIRTFPQADISFEPDHHRQGIVDSWPAGLNDKQARTDWGWQPTYDVERAFDDYLVPNIRQRYR
ncbi:L-threonine 3-dehydrogenase [hydrothermal vent metagenome]|uniref:L-threonine 3-dehydrogenase n=1 Tax=hydrothermal vent metagenome TaxID=652676 RepID=A0A3B0V5S3_9ZZZZ